MKKKTAEAEPVIKVQVKDVSFSYEHQRILEGVNFSVKEKEMVTILGPNGGGKTTLLKLILGLLSPQRGEVLIDGKSPKMAKGVMGYVPQYSQFDVRFPITVFESVLTGRLRKAWGFYNSEDREAVWRVLDEMGLREQAHNSFTGLSGGQRQRVLIARALVGEPEILLMDEPTANVDAVIGEHFFELLGRLNEQFTILLVTHDLGFVNNNTDRVFCVNRAVHEHPADQVDEGLIHSAYGRQVKVVRHDIDLCHSDT